MIRNVVPNPGFLLVRRYMSSSGIGITNMNNKKRNSPFYKLVQGLKRRGERIAVVESCCGGLINASILQIPGSSTVYYGGSVAYNTRHAVKLLLGDKILQEKLLKASLSSSSAEDYINSKKIWTEECAKAFCDALDVDYAIAEGGASGPTFRPSDLDSGFTVLAIAGRSKSKSSSKAELLAQTVVRSDHANRTKNMQLFADAAAKLAIETIGIDINSDDNGSGDRGGIASTPVSAALWLDRATHLRANDEVLQELENRPDAKCVVLKDSNECLLMNTKTGGIALALVPLRSIVEITTSSTSSTFKNCPFPKSFLGLDPNGSPVYVVDVNTDTDNEVIVGLLQNHEIVETTSQENRKDTVVEDVRFENTRTHAPLLVAHENELVLYATALSQWKRTHKFCPTTGHKLTETEGGTCLESKIEDGGSGAKWWPRMDRKS